jgi:methionine-rich copper-binding protein CopC
MMPIAIRRTAPMLVLGWLASMSAAAEPTLMGSKPANDETLSSAPQEIVLDFAEPVALAAVIVHESDGKAHAIVPLPTERDAHLVVAAPKLESGRYTIEWRALSDSTHATTGAFSFTIK